MRFQIFKQNIMTEKKIVKAEGERKPASGPVKVEGNPKLLRIGAAVCWGLAIVAEILCICIIGDKIGWFETNKLAGIIVTLVVDMLFAIGGSILWKKANHIDPASEANKTKFWLWNNLGVIITVIAFAPAIIILLCSKNLDKKTKSIGSVVAIIAMAIAGLSSYDFNPVSQEQQQEMYNDTDVDVYWVKTGEKYHTHSDCQHLNASTQEEIICGSIGQAEEAGKKELCKTCYKRDLKEKQITDVQAEKAVETTTETETPMAE